MPETSTAKACTRQVIVLIGACRLLYHPRLFLGLLRTTIVPAQANRWAPWWSTRTRTRGQQPLREANRARFDVWTCSRVEKVLEQEVAHTAVHLHCFSLLRWMLDWPRRGSEDGRIGLEHAVHFLAPLLLLQLAPRAVAGLDGTRETA